MRSALRQAARAATLVLALSTVAIAQEPGGDVPVEQDLLAVLKLRGKPCQAVASYRRLAESDYLVVCTDGPRYRVFVEGERVEIQDR